MALIHFALIFLFALFFCSLHEIQARDAQMFNKIPSQTNLVEVEVKQPNQNLPKKEATEPVFNPEQQQDEQPNFIPENSENDFGHYGHESVQFPPSTQTQNNNNFPHNAKYLPKNYNTVAYVTQPEGFKDNTYTENSYQDTPTDTNDYQTQDNGNTYYSAQKREMNNGFNFMDSEENTSGYDNTNNYYNNDVVNNNNNNNFNARSMDSETRNRVNRVEPQGMSDTRFMEHGKYNYDINSGKYSRDHPYVNPMAMRNQYNPPEYNNIENNYQYNNYNDEEQYQNEDNMP